ncbi:MAG: translation initiation factor IF-3 [Verrucomicrobiales bacterium]|nr:translation initiation factor IF-3 [Verrucomicrobiales bacterium]
MIGSDGSQVGVMDLGAAINMARNQGYDLVEVSASANPPVCRIVDFGKFKYEQSKRDRESKKHHHANIVKEVQLTPRIDPHDLGIKQEHAIEFLCEDMKVKVALRFRGREMAHTEIGMAVVEKFLKDIAPWGHPDFTPKLVGRSINVMVSPLPRAKRARNPKAVDRPPGPAKVREGDDHGEPPRSAPSSGPAPSARPVAETGSEAPPSEAA